MFQKWLGNKDSIYHVTNTHCWLLDQLRASNTVYCVIKIYACPHVGAPFLWGPLCGRTGRTCLNPPLRWVIGNWSYDLVVPCVLDVLVLCSSFTWIGKTDTHSASMDSTDWSSMYSVKMRSGRMNCWSANVDAADAKTARIWALYMSPIVLLRQAMMLEVFAKIHAQNCRPSETCVSTFLKSSSLPQSDFSLFKYKKLVNPL